MTKVAVVGIGNMGRNHLRVLMDIPEAHVVGVADLNKKALDTAAQRYGVAIFEDYRQMLDEAAPDGIVVSVPTTSHREVTLEAIRRGISVLIEKPIAFSREEAEEMIAAARRQGVKLAVGHIERFNPAVVELKKRMESGQLGRAFMIHARRQSPVPRQVSDVGVAMDLATHELDMMLYLTGSDVVSLNAEISQVLRDKTREDIVFGLLRFDNGVLGVIDVNWVTPTTIRELVITGERGMFVVDYLRQDLYFYENPGARAALENVWDFSVNAGNMTRYQIERREPLRNELDNFVAAIATGSDVLIDGEAGLRSLNLALDIVAKGKQSRVG